MPTHGEECLGGHAVVIAGYDDAKKTFLMRNSWGSGWGQGGYFELKYEFFNPALKYVSDIWRINTMGSLPVQAHAVLASAHVPEPASASRFKN